MWFYCLCANNWLFIDVLKIANLKLKFQLSPSRIFCIINLISVLIKCIIFLLSRYIIKMHIIYLLLHKIYILKILMIKFSIMTIYLIILLKKYRAMYPWYYWLYYIINTYHIDNSNVLLKFYSTRKLKLSKKMSLIDLFNGPLAFRSSKIPKIINF